MAKKKKTQLKPVARGFATTSVPKKIIETPLAEETTSATPSQPPSSGTQTPIDSHDVQLDVSDPASVQEQSLQNVVDKLQEKTEKEISRILKAIEVDRRYSQTLTSLDIDPILRQRILEQALEISETDNNQRPLDESEQRATSKLSITYGVLRRLGFSEEKTTECIQSIGGVDLDEALDWLYLHCTEEELDPNSSSLGATENVDSKSSKPTTPCVPIPSLSKDLTSEAPLLAKPVPRAESADERVITSANVPSSIKSRILATYGHSYESDALDQEDPNIVYSRLKIRQDALNLDGKSQETIAMTRELQKEMDTAKQDYLFDERLAMEMYKQERIKMDKAILEAKLQSTSNDSAKTRAKKIKPPPPPPIPSAERDLFDDSDSDDSSSGMLGLLDAAGATEVVVKGVTFSLRDLETPKHWSGPMPKTLLRDFTTKVDKYAAITYTRLSTHSRAKRASLTISWSNRKKDEWTMDDVACPSDSQAEQYISLIALHSLVYPLTEGFASPSPISNSNATSFRLLPAPYRELWEELEISRKAKCDEINRAVWEKLQGIISTKLENNSKAPGKRPPADKQSSKVVRGYLDSKDVVPDHLVQNFAARQMSPQYQEMLERRSDLPIARYRQHINDILQRSQVLVLSGETGCGKSTQVPAFILEDQLSKGKPCRIYCTEPRRISAISLAQRVSYELCDPPNSVGTNNALVGYSIRLESNISRNTHLAFVTNGIALRMLEGGSGQGGQGTAFDEITHLIIDEVHERTIESDFLLIVLKSLLNERPDLKVILMSATVDAEKISAYFGNCETLHVPGRTFPVDVKFLEDAIDYTKWKLADNSPYARRAHDKYYKAKNREWSEEAAAAADDDDDDDDQGQPVKLEKRYSPETTVTLNTLDERIIPYDLIVRLLEMICFEDGTYAAFSPAILIFMPGLGEIRRLNDLLVEHRLFGSEKNFKIHPLHSTLSSESQGAIFDIPPPGIRKIVIATNIAETGITIPDITCVIDTGKHREMRFDEKRQISRLVETFIARSNAAQRRGRAGRVQNGLCFHLFTKMRHDTQMADSPLPEMMRLSLSDLALRIKIMKIKLGSSIEDVLSRAMDPPISINVQRAVSMLVEVRALTSTEEITPMGRLLSKLPTDVHLGKFLLIATIFRCLDPALTIAATLNSKSPFLSPLGLEQEANRSKNSFRIGTSFDHNWISSLRTNASSTENSDFLTIHNAFSSWRRASSNPGGARNFCRVNFLSHENLQQIEDLRQQFLGYLIDSSFVKVDKSIVRELSRARYVRNRTRFMNVPAELDANSNNPLLVNAALTAGLYPKILSIDPKGGQMRTITNNQQVFFHPSSINFKRNVQDFGVNHMAYFTLMHSRRLYVWETGPVDDLAMLMLCGETDFKLISNIASLDRKIKYNILPKTAIALKIIREKLTALLALQYQGKPLNEAQSAWMELGFIALSRVKLGVEKETILLAK